MTGQDDLAGSLATQCRNVHSGSLYCVSTVPQTGDACWTTVIFPCIEQRSWFGLVKRQIPDPSRMLSCYIRNSQPEAQQVHALVTHMVTTQPEALWNSVEPDPMPPDGFSEQMQRKMEAGGHITPEIRARFRSKS
jgi:hypothetical protein